MFDRKGFEVDSTDQTFEEITRPFRAQLEALVAEPEPPAPEPRWRTLLADTARAIGGTLLGLVGLAAVGAGLGMLAFIARIGWRLAG